MECAEDNGSDFLVHLNHDLSVFNKNNECNLIQHLPLSPPSELQEIPVAIREQSGVLCFHSRGMPVSPGESGMQPRDPCRPWRGTLASGYKPRSMRRLRRSRGTPPVTTAGSPRT